MSALLVTSPRSRSRQAENQGRLEAGAFARLLAALGLARAILRQSFATREDAVQARARLVNAMEPLLELAASDLDLSILVTTAYGTALSALDTALLTLKPLVRVNTGEPLPVCLVAWQLYGDTTRMDELAALNGDRTPEFMPSDMLAARPDGA